MQSKLEYLRVASHLVLHLGHDKPIFGCHFFVAVMVYDRKMDIEWTSFTLCLCVC